MPVNRIKQKNNFVDSTKNSIEKKKGLLQPQITIVNSYTLIAFLYCASSVILFYYVVENIFLAIIHLLALFSIITNYLILIQTKNFNRATNIILTTGTIVVISLFATGGWANTGYLWPFAYLPFAFFLSDRTATANWVAALFGGCLVVVFLHFIGAITIPYSPAALVNYFAASLVFIICIFLFQKATVKREEFLSYTEILLEAAPDAVIVIDNEGRIVKWNPKSETLFGWTADEVSGKPLSEIIIPHRYRAAHEKGLKDFLETGEGPVLDKTIEIQAINRTNDEFDVALSISPAIVQNKQVFIGFVRDITERKKSEEKIRESGNMFSTLFYKSPVLKAIIEVSSGKYIEVNDAFVDFLEDTRENICGKTFLEINLLGPPEERGQLIKNIQKDGFARELEMQFNSKNGKASWVSTNIDLVNLNGKDCFLSAGIDITKRKIAEENLLTLSEELEAIVLERTEELSLSEKSYRHLFENNPMPMWVIDLNTFKFLDVNEIAILQYGYSREEFFSMTTLDIRPDEDKELFQRPDHLSEMNTTNYSQGIWNHRKKNGTIIQAEVIAHQITFEGAPARLVLSNDVTERKKAEEKLDKSEKLFRAMIEKDADMKTLATQSGKVFYVSPSLTKILGYEGQEFMSIPPFELIHPDDVPGLIEGVTGIVQIPGKSFYHQQRLKHKNGTWLWCEGTTTNMLHEPAVAALVSNFRDITERKQAEEAIKLAEANYREIFDKASDAIYVHEMETGKVIEVNQRASKITGYATEELLNSNPQEFITDNPDYTLQHAMHYLQKAAAGEPQLFEWLNKNKDGSHNWLEVNLKKASIAGKDRILAFFREINDRKKAQMEIQKLNEGLELKVILRTAELQKSNELFSKLFNHNPASIAISSIIDGKLIDVNDSYLLLNGYSSKEEVLGKTTFELNRPVQQEQRAEIVRILKENESIESLEISVFDKLGDKKWLQLSAIMLEIGNVPCLLSVSIDITERKKAEEQLTSVNKELEAFSYSVSHDLRAPLRAINGFAKMLGEDYGTVFDKEGKRLFKRIEENAKKMGFLIDDLLEFSRIGRKEIHKSRIQMTELFEATLSEINTTINHEAAVKIHQLHVANADSTMIKQVMINLLSNAIKYSSRTEKPSIVIKSHLEENEIIYSVSDNGVGFNNKFVHKLFGVFQRLHLQTDFEGTGVGLALVKRIINKHGGRVWAIGELNKGATFCFSLPATNNN